MSAPDPVLAAAQALAGTVACCCGRPAFTVIGAMYRGRWMRATLYCGHPDCAAFTSFGGPHGDWREARGPMPPEFVREGNGRAARAVERPRRGER